MLLPGAHAQLNENCTVSILNRTAQVQHDGTWIINNVPAGFGLVRARATCVQNGVTQFGQSDLFQINANQVTGFNANIILGSTTPIPTSMAVTATPASLTTKGQTSQLTVIATYPNGTTANVTAASTGTQYKISNPAIATVSAGGLVTAVSSGTAVIQAINEGTQGIFTFNIVLGGAVHGGIPDSWTISFGLDPNDPALPFEDPDHDGLTNLQEFQQGTDPKNPDTDGDGLTDGQESLAYHTSPVLADTDGDGIPDGLEVQAGTDPLNKASFNLAKALSSLEVKPSAFVLTVNSLVGVASQQLSVIGHLADGKTTIDLTSTQKGTNYASSNLTICNFGAPDGNVFAGSSGSCTITVTNNGFTGISTGIVSGFTPTPLSFVSIPGYANNVDVSGNYAYVAAGSTGLQVVDVTDRTKPKVVAAVDTPGNANDVQVVGNFAYVADGFSGIQIVNITNPLAPAIVGSFNTPSAAWDLAVSGGIAYVADDTSGLQVIDVSTPAAPAKLGSLALTGTTKGLDIDLSRNLVVAVGSGGLFTVNIANPKAPALVGSVNYGGDPRDIALKGNFAFVADFSLSLSSIDITNPATPIYKVSTDPNLGGLLHDVVVSGNFAIGADVKFVNGVPIVDISGAPALQPRAILNFCLPNFTCLNGFRDDNSYGIAVDGAYVYVTAGRDLDNDNGVTGDTRLYIGQYNTTGDKNGVPPMAQITAPTDGSNVIQGSQLQITVNATDDVGVAAVNILVNGQIVFTATSAPYQFTYSVAANATTLTIGAQAIDFGNNVGTAKLVSVTAIPDPLTTAQGIVVDAKNVPVPGAAVVCAGKNGTSAADGSFSITGLSTVQGPIICTASAIIGGVSISGSSLGVAPVRGGVTNVGTIVLSLLGSRGRDFWVAFPSAVEQPTAQLFIVSDGTANYTVSNASAAFTATGTVTPQAPAVVAIPGTLTISSNQVIENQGIHVTTDADVSVFFYYPSSTNFTADTYLAIPTPALGTDYYGLSYLNDLGFPSQLTVIGTQNTTNITIGNLANAGCSSTTPFTATLNQGQTYQLQCTDVSALHVTSNNPVAVLAGANCTDIPVGGLYCDVISEEMFPVGRLWSTDIYSAPLPGTGLDFYRVLASANGTTVTVDKGAGGIQTFNLNQGQFQEISFKAGAHFTSNLPILVMQYLASSSANGGTGDPSSMQLVPVALFAQSFRFYAPPNQSYAHYAVIIAPNAAVGAVQLNGNVVTGFSALPGAAFQYAVATAADGQNVVTSTLPITVYSVGTGNTISYGTPTRF